MLKVTKTRETIEFNVRFPMERFEDDPETVLSETEMPDEFLELVNDGWSVLNPTNMVTHANGQTGKVEGSATVRFVRVPPHEKTYKVEAVVTVSGCSKAR